MLLLLTELIDNTAYTLQLIRPSDAFIPLAVALVSAGVAAYGTYKKAQDSKKLRDSQMSILKRNQTLADVYEAEANRDFFDTDVAKGAVNKLGTQLRKANKKSADVLSKKGATAEQEVATKAKNLESYGKALSNIASYGSQYKDNMRMRYQGLLGGLYNENNLLYGADVKSDANLQNNAFNTLSASVSAIDESDEK